MGCASGVDTWNLGSCSCSCSCWGDDDRDLAGCGCGCGCAFDDRDLGLGLDLDHGLGDLGLDLGRDRGLDRGLDSLGLDHGSLVDLLGRGRVLGRQTGRVDLGCDFDDADSGRAGVRGRGSVV